MDVRFSHTWIDPLSPTNGIVSFHTYRPKGTTLGHRVWFNHNDTFPYKAAADALVESEYPGKGFKFFFMGPGIERQAYDGHMLDYCYNEDGEIIDTLWYHNVDAVTLSFNYPHVAGGPTNWHVYEKVTERDQPWVVGNRVKYAKFYNPNRGVQYIYHDMTTDNYDRPVLLRHGL